MQMCCLSSYSGAAGLLFHIPNHFFSKILSESVSQVPGDCSVGKGVFLFFFMFFLSFFFPSYLFIY